jgi:thiamine pyrophosphokinase
MSAFTILLGGEVTPTARLRAQVRGTRVIAADSGVRHCGPLALVPELWVGDFDSSDADLQDAYADIPREVFDANKDASDGDLAITAALQRGADFLNLVGALGGQLDHLLCHVIMLLTLHKRDIGVMMSSGKEEAYALQSCVLSGHSVGTRFSIIPTSNLVGLTIAGARWPLTSRRVPAGASLTLSNAFAEGDVTIRLTSGEGLIVVYPDGAP